jgi:Flp pilus assembly protein TadG
MLHTNTGSRRRTGRARRGAAVIETALVCPVLMILLVGSMDLARVLFAYGTVAEASRVGARYAMVHGAQSSSPVGPTANDATVASTVKANAPALNTTNLTVTSTWLLGTNDASSPVTVTVSYPCSLSLGNLIGLKSITVSNSTTMIITH